MKKEEVNYFKVIAKCGHVGRCKYIPITFAIIANNGKEAAKKARYYPRVKHDNKNAILSCDKIPYDEYLLIKEANDNDPYLKCKSKYDQKMTCDLDDRIEVYRNYKRESFDDFDRLKRVKFKLAKYKTIITLKCKDNDYDYAY